VDAMVTNHRLIIHSTGWDVPYEVELSASPDIEYDGLFTFPISVSDFGKRLLFALIPGAIAWILWSYAQKLAVAELPTVTGIVLRYSVLGLSGLMFILACGGLLMSVIDTFSTSRRRTVFRSRLKTSGNPEVLCLHHGSPIRRTVVGYNTMVAFAHRVRSIVARQSRLGAVSDKMGGAITARMNPNVTHVSGNIAHQMTRPIDIFFSYAHEDEALMDDVRRQLIGFDRRNIIRKWHDRQIPPGTEWKGQIDGRLQHSDIILLFITPHFIESDYCYDAEMTEAMRRHDSGEARVIPIILRPCPWHEEPFGRLQALPIDGKALTTWPNRDEGALNIAEGIMSVVRQLIVSR
jgi:hypothetical protein